MNATGNYFFWTDGGTRIGRGTYHWCIECAWLQVALWHGAQLVADAAPPRDALDADDVRRDLEAALGVTLSPRDSPLPPGSADSGRWLCTVCSHYAPRPVAQERKPPAETCVVCGLPKEVHDTALWPFAFEPEPPEEPCAACGCSKHMHHACRGPFDTGCGMAWRDARVGALDHCPCDGYQPPGTPGLSGLTDAAGDDDRHAPCLYRRRWGSQE